MAGIAMAAHDFGLDGHLARARVVLDDVDPSRGGGPDPASLVAWLAADAALRFAAGDGAGTVASAERGLALAASSGARLLDFLLTAELAWGGALDGRLDLADRALASLAVLYQPTLPIQGTWLHQSRCLVALARHDRSRALEEIRAARAASQRSGSELSVVLDLVGEAIVAGPGGEAPPLPGPTLEAALEAARRCGSRWAEHMVLMGLAARERRVGGPRLEARLLEAFAQARQTGYANPVYLLREEVAELCAAALERGIEPDSARAVARVNRLAPPAWARALDGWPWALSVRVLGGLEVEVGGARADALADGGRALELLGVLVALGGSDVDGGRIATELWPDSEGDAARHALETALYRLRKALGDPALVVQAHGLVGLAGGRCWTDLGELQARLTGLERASLAQPGTGGGELTRLAAAVLEAYPGPLLPGLDLPAVCERRGTLDRRVRRIVGLAAAALDRASRPADASMLRAALVARCDPPDP
jgi:alkylhydroperoxidase/carboxymuconolactone decarboxylase family protein YurZ